MKKIIISIWLTGIVVFGGMAVYLNKIQDRINAPGEMSEVLAGMGIVLISILIFASLLIFFIGKRKQLK